MEEPHGAPPGRAALWRRSGAGGSSADRRPEVGGGRRPGGRLGVEAEAFGERPASA